MTYAERDGQLATASDRVDSEGSVTGGRRIPVWSEVDRAFQVGKDADGFGLVALMIASWVSKRSLSSQMSAPT